MLYWPPHRCRSGFVFRAGGARRRGTDDGVACAARAVHGQAAGHLLLRETHEVLHLFLHLLHSLAHIEDDLDAGEVDAHVAGERKDHLEALEVLVGVQPRIAVRARRLEQPLPLIEAQGLRVDLVQLGYDADHVTDPPAFFHLGHLFADSPLTSPRARKYRVAGLPRRICSARAAACGRAPRLAGARSPGPRHTDRRDAADRARRRCLSRAGGTSGRCWCPAGFAAAPGRQWWALPPWRPERPRPR